jgi:hypothetical protein
VNPPQEYYADPYMGVPNSFMARGASQETANIFIERMSHETHINDLLRTVLGIEASATPNGNVVLKQTQYSLMADLNGAYHLKAWLYGYVNKISALTDLNEDLIGKHVYIFGTHLNRWIAKYGIVYGLKQSAEDMVFSELVAYVHFQLLRAKDRRESEISQTAYIQQKNIMREEETKRKAWALFGGGKPPESPPVAP